MDCNYNVYIQFNGKKSLDILDTKLILCHMDYSDEVSAFTRTVNKSETNYIKYIPNYYGSKYEEPTTFKVSFIKEDFSNFTNTDLRTINKWLLSNTIPTKLELYGSDSWNSNLYWKAIVTDISYSRFAGTIAMTITFECDSQFCYEQYNKTIVFTRDKELATNPFITTDTNDKSYSLIMSKEEWEAAGYTGDPWGSFRIYIDSDINDLGYIYPKLSIQFAEAGECQIINIEDKYKDKNKATKHHRMCINALAGLRIVLDCQNYRLTDNAGNILNISDMFDDDDIDPYWYRLLPTEVTDTQGKVYNVTTDGRYWNRISTYSPMTVNIQFENVKKVGVPDEFTV